jgi:hypothetical protein
LKVHPLKRWADRTDHAPEEIHNLAEEHADVVKELTAEILTTRQRKNHELQANNTLRHLVHAAGFAACLRTRD